MDYTFLDLLLVKLNIKYIKNEPMSKHTSFKIGGTADRFIQIQTQEQTLEIIKFLDENNIYYFILGNGSNLLVSDDGIRGVVINLIGEFKNIELLDNNIIKCGSGAMLSAVSVFAKKHNLTGLEFAYGIPATIGGAVYMNAGAYNGEMSQIVWKSCHITNGEIVELYNKDLDFSYRYSQYNDKKSIITYVYLKLKQGNPSDINCKMQQFMNNRKEKQPLEYPSAGSTFKRPNGYFAAALIDECGLKGLSVGGAMVSNKHAGFVINVGNATAQDVITLTQKIKEEVYKQKQVDLNLEIKIIN